MLLCGIEVKKLGDAWSDKMLHISCFLRILFASSTRQSQSEVVMASLLIANALTNQAKIMS
jgi:hypothetical protein